MAKNTGKKTGMNDAPSLFDGFGAMDDAEGFETMGEKHAKAPAKKSEKSAKPKEPIATPLEGGIGLLYEGERHIVRPENAPVVDVASENVGNEAVRSVTEDGDEPLEPASSDPELEDAEDTTSSPEATSDMSIAMTGDAEEDGALVLARYASQAYLEYAMSVVKSRALPEVSDGQKPVQRRILVDMDRMGIRWDAKNVKSARVVGDVLGKYHPHGDQSVYDALVRMAQDFSMRYPLIAGEGNFGSRDGDSQAAMRYTETRLMPIAKLLLDELDQGAVEFVPNYDGNFTEPVELPAKLPFVLLNGSSGIAVGMATEIPSHNLREVAAAAVLLLEKPEATLDEVMSVLPAPDFPCGAQIISSRREIRDIYATGRGKLRVRARYHFEELARGQWQLVVDELPPAASSKIILDRIEAITNPKVKKEKKSLSAKQQQAKTAMLAMLDRVRDESGGGVPVRLVFEPKSSRTDRDEFVNLLLTQTELESNVPVNLVMLGIDGKPCQKTLLQILNEWLQFRIETVRRRSQSRLDKVLDRIHVLEGRQLVLLNIDRVIEIIRSSDEPKPALMAEFGLTERQAEDILEIRLRQLARLAAIAIEKELAALGKERAQLERVLGNEGALKRLVAKEINEAAKEFGDDRRTLVEEAAIAAVEQTVADEPVTVVISKKGFLRARTGHGHDCALMNFKMGDGFLLSLECRTVDNLTIVDNTGRVYSIAVSNLPGARGDGLPLSSFIDMEKGADPIAYFAGAADRDVVFVTTDGMGLVASLGDLATRLKAGRSFVKVADGETLLKALPVVTGATKIACLSSGGRLLIFGIDEIRRLASGGKGVTLMQLEAGEKLLDAAVIDERGVIVKGTGRGGKPREALVSRRSFAEHTLRRARKGRALDVAWKPESLETLPPQPTSSPDDGSLPSGSKTSGLVLEVVDDNTPTLL